MTDYAVILEMRKKKIGGVMHFIHFLLTIMTLIWGVVWLGHYLGVYFHNKKLDEQIDTLIGAKAAAITAKLQEKQV